MKVLELFAGAGGAALGLEAAGCEHLACVEWDEDACSTMRAAGLPAVQGDVRDVSLYLGMSPDILWSSFPCQAWSTAGKRRGAEDERNMWPATINAVSVTKPTWFVGENVVGLTNHKGACKRGRSCVGSPLCPNAYFNNVILRDLKRQFEWVDWKILDSADFGVPQRRRRVFILAGPHPVDWPEQTHANPEKEKGLFDKNLLPWNTVGDSLGLHGELSGSRNSTSNPKQERPANTSEPSPTIGGKGNQMLRVIGGGRNPQSPELASKRNYRDLTDEPCTTIPAVQVGNAGPWVVAGSQPELLNRPAPTVTTTEVKGTRGRHMGKALSNGKKSGGVDRASDAVWLATGRRRLTVEECAKLMDFPDDYPFVGTKTSRYRQIGNAVTPVMAQRIAESILGKTK
jgi:DNA (cytosine-5)-methyltransferase 1